MEMLNLIEQYKKRLEINSSDHTCLLFALQIPSICSRIEFLQTPENTGKNEDGKLYKSNGNPWDANMYKEWLVKHSDSFADIYRSSMELNTFCNVMYELRCQITHEGILMADGSHFYFTNGDNAMCLGDIVFLPIKRLCNDMFNAATMLLFNNQEKINITPFEDIFLSDDMYSRIRNDLSKTYKLFWDKYSDDDKMLECIYNNIILNKPDITIEIDKFFENYPDDNYEIWDFGIKFGYIIDIEQRFIKQKYDENKSRASRILNVDSDVLCLSKAEYERMLQVHEKFENFTEAHPFDITQYYENPIL